MSYLKGYLEALDKCESICKSYIAELRNQSGPAKVTVACANNIIDFVRDDIQAHAHAIRQDHGIPDPKPVFSVDMGKANNVSTLPPRVGSAQQWKKKPLGSK